MNRLAVVALLGLAGCPLPHIDSLATLKAEDLPADPAALAAKAEALLVAGNAVSLENALVVLEKQRTLAKGDVAEYEVLWRQARVTFWLCDEAEKNVNRREFFASKGIDYADAALDRDQNRVEAHYYRALNSGYLATTKTLGALDLLPEILREGQAAEKINERFDHAGPHRLLSALYRQAPTWPSSVGDIDEAVTHGERAVALDPAFPFNHLVYAEALHDNNKSDEAQHEAELAIAATTTDPLWVGHLPQWRKEVEELMKKIAPTVTPKIHRR